jgi:hypothetical protein
MPSATEIPSQDPPLSYTASSQKWLTYETPPKKKKKKKTTKYALQFVRG